MTRFALMLLVAAGCGGGSKSATTPGGGGGGDTGDMIPRTAGPECAVVADKLATVMHADTPDQQGEAKATLEAKCTTDKWSDEARNCFATVETDAEVNGCTKLLDDNQRASLGVKPSPEAPKTGAGNPLGGAPGGGVKGTRGGTRSPSRNSADPCEGGEVQSDPCEGGEHK